VPDILDLEVEPPNFEENQWIDDYNMAQPRPINLTNLPQYYGLARSDPDHHLDRFNIVCQCNMIPEASKLTTFPATLLGIAQEWHATNGPFPNWDALRTAFLARFRPLSFTESLQERLRTIRMALGENVNNYYSRMEYILQRWASHGIPDAYLTGIFVGGLYPPEFKISIKEKNPRTIVQAVQYTKQYEEARIGEDQLSSIDPNLYPSDLIPP